MAEYVIHFGGAEAEYLKLTLWGRSAPDATDYWDGNWFVCNADVAAGGFRGAVSGDLRTEELASFAVQLGRLQESLWGEAEFDTMEDWLSIRITGDGRGHMELRCRLQDRPGDGNTLEFALAIDQSFTRSSLAQLAAAVRAFPVVGSPNAKPTDAADGGAGVKFKGFP